MYSPRFRQHFRLSSDYLAGNNEGILCQHCEPVSLHANCMLTAHEPVPRLSAFLATFLTFRVGLNQVGALNGSSVRGMIRLPPRYLLNWSVNWTAEYNSREPPFCSNGSIPCPPLPLVSLASRERAWVWYHPLCGVHCPCDIRPPRKKSDFERKFVRILPEKTRNLPSRWTGRLSAVTLGEILFILNGIWVLLRLIFIGPLARAFHVRVFQHSGFSTATAKVPDVTLQESFVLN